MKAKIYRQYVLWIENLKNGDIIGIFLDWDMYYGASTENLLYLNVSAKVQTLRQSLFTENPLSPAACTE